MTTPSPTTGKFIADVPTETEVTLSYVIIAGSVTPTNVSFYFSSADGNTKTTAVSKSSGGPDGTTGISDDGAYLAVAASLTIDAINCELYTKLCVLIIVDDDCEENNLFCVDFGITADKVGTKVCSGKCTKHSSIV